MIKCEQDLINTYIKNDFGELRDLYLAKCETLGLSINSACYTTRSEVIFTKGDKGQFGNVDHSGPDICFLVDKFGEMTNLTLSDLKPRTKEVYEKVSFNHAWELVKHFELQDNLYYKSSSTPTYEKISLSNIESMLRNTYPVKLYRKVEKEIDWRDEVSDFVINNKIIYSCNGHQHIKAIRDYTDEQFLEMCRVALRATGELNDGQ